ncbi:hypothetical protein CTE07_15330 [Chitinophaga terrae (ex Kim and Jung 2007)]|nr:hypothetical protein CTE07_15330 [Chitinophaga terrae (ex Kim and Jung 2007)]
MWDLNSPLNIYARTLVRKDTTDGGLKTWAVAAPMMNDYGIQLIKTYPTEFFRYYIIPNSIKYYTPPVEFMEVYNSGVGYVNPIAKKWFHLKSSKVTNRVKGLEIRMLDYFPILVAVMNVLIVLNIISFFVLKMNRQFPELLEFISIVFVVWLINFGFSVFSAPIALRFQLFPILISMALVFLLMEKLIVVAFKKQPVMNLDSSNIGIHAC